MSDPVLVEVLRGALVESRHRGAVAVADAEGATVLALGDVDAGLSAFRGQGVAGVAAYRDRARPTLRLRR